MLDKVSGLWLMWVGIIYKWLLKKDKEIKENDEKKKRKMERRMKRK
jgi:hypothetical protein